MDDPGAHPAVGSLEGPAGLVSLADVEAAAVRLRGVVLETPLLPLGRRDGDPPGLTPWLKPENLQPMGAFKIRGAYNALAQLDSAARAAGVVTHSSGNHAQGVSRAAALLGIHAVVVMPRDAVAIKIAGVRADGAEIDFVGASNEERIERADRLADERGLTLIPSYDDVRIVAGQGTVGLEIAKQIATATVGGERPLTVLAPIGGGGLAAGICVAVKTLRPDAQVIAVEPELAADARDSMRQGRVVRWDPALAGRTIADGVRTSALGKIPFAHLRRLLDRVITVSEAEITAAMALAASRARIVAEPSGALSIAAWRWHAEQLPTEGDVVMVVSGGNVDGDRYLAQLAQGAGFES
jgi:threonine dehydratase